MSAPKTGADIFFGVKENAPENQFRSILAIE